MSPAYFPQVQSIRGGTYGGTLDACIVGTPKGGDVTLTAKQVECAKPKGNNYKLSHQEGLFLYSKKSGAKYWRYKYRYLGKEKSLAGLPSLRRTLMP